MHAVISVIGKDRIGILAAVANQCAAYHINILEVSQTILHGIFSMTMIVDMKDMETSFETFAQEMEKLGIRMELIIKVMNQEIFDAMHTL